jgi:chromosome segregation ATPase
MNKLPERVDAAIAEYRAHERKRFETLEAVRQQNEELKAELAQAERELQAAMDAALEKPTKANSDREAALRRKIEDLKLELAAGEERYRRAQTLGQEKSLELARKAADIGREEGQRHFDENIADVLKKIEDCKHAYLRALVDYHNLRRHAWAIYHTALTETNANVHGPGEGPRFPEVYFHYRRGERQVYGISPDEIDEASKNGIIRRTSVAPGREIE